MKEILSFEAENSVNLEANNEIRFADVKLETGVQIHYAEQGNENGQAVILLHGYSDSSFSFSRVIPLIDRRFHVFALDQRGHGDSERPISNYRFSDFAVDVLAFMDAKNLEKAVIVGHSMGSHIAQRIAVSAPERVEKLVLIGSATTLQLDTVFELQEAVNEFTDTVPFEFVEEFQYSTAYRELPKDFMNQVVTESLKLPARVWREVMKGMLADDSKAELHKITAPTLIMWGEKEIYFLLDEQNALLAAIPNSVLKIYEEVGHNPHWENPEQFVKDLERFINQN
jgi:non-heme chloroperoxidase